MLLNGGGEGKNFSGLPKDVLPLLHCVYNKNHEIQYMLREWFLHICAMAYLHGKIILLFFCPSPGNRPHQSCGAVVGWGLGALPILIHLGMSNNFSQVEFVSPRTVVGEQCSCLYLQPWTFWFRLLPLSPGCGQTELIASHLSLLLQSHAKHSDKEMPECQRATDQPEQEVSNNCTLDWKAIFAWAVWRGECVSREKNETKGKWLGFFCVFYLSHVLLWGNGNKLKLKWERHSAVFKTSKTFACVFAKFCTASWDRWD